MDNRKYELEYAYESLLKIPQLKLEISIILIQLNRLEEAAKNILECQQTNLIFYIKKIIKKFPYFDLVSLIIMSIKSNYPFNVKNLYDTKKDFDISMNQIKSHFNNIKLKENFEKENYEERISIKIEHIFLDILTEIYDEFELILVHFFIYICN